MDFPQIAQLFAPKKDARELERLAIATSRVDGRRSLAVVDLEERLVGELGFGLERITEPSWSPDGTTIAVAVRRDASEAFEVVLLPAPK